MRKLSWLLLGCLVIFWGCGMPKDTRRGVGTNEGFLIIQAVPDDAEVYVDGQREADYGTHDWEFILNEIGWLRYDHTLAALAHSFGMVLMLLSFGWAGYLLLKQYRNLDTT